MLVDCRAALTTSKTRAAGRRCPNAVEDVDGDIEVNHINGSITLMDVAGSIVSHGVNGSIRATFVGPVRIPGLPGEAFEGPRHARELEGTGVRDDEIAGHDALMPSPPRATRRNRRHSHSRPPGRAGRAAPRRARGDRSGQREGE